MRSPSIWSDRSRPLSRCSLRGIRSSIRATCRRARCDSIRSAPAQFKFAEFKPNERITVTRNRDYWKKDRPYLHGVEFTIIRDVSTVNLAFAVDKLDWIGMAIPLLKEVKGRVPEAICEVAPGSGSPNQIVDGDTPPFDNAEMRRAIALSA
jgi:peptide/nickel transport system substrate-binding protein